MARQGIEHFVREHHAAHRLRGQRVEPHDALAQLGRQSLDARPLPLPQVRADFENGVLLGQVPSDASVSSIVAAIRPVPAPSSRMEPPVCAEHFRALLRDARC